MTVMRRIILDLRLCSVGHGKGKVVLVLYLSTKL
jgi:hypothetical protein